MVAVSVVMITYNHESFIKDALIGVLEQKTDFSLELILANDCSSDNTDTIIRTVIESYNGPISIIYTNNDSNLGMMGNFIYALNKASGQYVALCEGDDYWTDPLKLQKQFDYLEKNPEYVLCFHKAKILEINGSIVDDHITVLPENYESIEALANFGNYIHTPTVMFRNIIKSYPNEMLSSSVGDYFLYMILARFGKIGMLDENMAIYRNEVGVWSGKSIEFRSFNFVYTLCNIYYYFEKFDKKISDLLFNKITYFITSNIHLFLDLALYETNSPRAHILINKILANQLINLRSQNNLRFQLKRFFKNSVHSIFKFKWL
ncbi:MAG: glycosyltransferase [Bacteroidota bacterium]|jgi:glycosyltransferase involved in cell wall biosynthesis